MSPPVVHLDHLELLLCEGFFLAQKPGKYTLTLQPVKDSGWSCVWEVPSLNPGITWKQRMTMSSRQSHGLTTLGGAWGHHWAMRPPPVAVRSLSAVFQGSLLLATHFSCGTRWLLRWQKWTLPYLTRALALRSPTCRSSGEQSWSWIRVDLH